MPVDSFLGDGMCCCIVVYLNEMRMIMLHNLRNQHWKMNITTNSTHYLWKGHDKLKQKPFSTRHQKIRSLQTYTKQSLVESEFSRGKTYYLLPFEYTEKWQLWLQHRICITVRGYIFTYFMLHVFSKSNKGRTISITHRRSVAVLAR